MTVDPLRIMTNQEIRHWYNEQVGRIDEYDIQWKAEGIGIAERARKVWEVRHNARLMARDMMLDKEEVEGLRARDLKLYGDPNGPRWEYLIKAAEMLGLTGDNVYEWIIKGAQRTNTAVNKRFE
jgi:hypothetical protein